MLSYIDGWESYALSRGSSLEIIYLEERRQDIFVRST